MKPLFALFSCTLVLTLSPARADTWTGTTSGVWNIDTNWQDGTKPLATDDVVFDANSTANLTTTLGAAFSITGLKVVDPTGAVTIANGGGSLTIGSGGIDLSTATQNLTISNAITLGANQTWSVANGRSLGFDFSGNNVPFDLGTRTVLKSGAGGLTFSGINISNGKLEIGGGSFTLTGGGGRANALLAGATVQVNTGASFTSIRSGGTSQISGTVALNGGTWIVNSAGGVATLNGSITVDATNGGTLRYATGSSGGLAQIISGNITGGGILNVENIATSSANNRFEFSGNNSGFTGTFSVNGASGNRYVRLTGANAGSASATFNVAAANRLEVNGVTVSLGNLTGTGVVRGSTGTSTLKIGALNTNATFGGVIDATNVVNVEKVGDGTFTLTGANTYTGTTLVSDGVLSVTGSLAAASAVTVASDGALIGTGMIGGNTSIAGTLAPGISQGTLTFTNSLELLSTAQLDWNLNAGNTAAGGGINDLVVVGNGLTLDGTFNFAAGAFTGLAEGTTWRLINYTGTLVDNGLEIGSLPALDPGQQWKVDTSIIGQVNLTIVPEPGALMLAAVGVLGLLRRRR